MASDCLFCRIAAGEHPASIVFDDQHSVAFLDHRPLFPGQCLLIPRHHYATLADLPPANIENFFASVRLLSMAVEEGLGAEGSFIAVNNRVSQSVRHLHVHVVPRRRKDGLRGFFWPRTRYSDETEAEAIREKLCKAVDRLKPSHAG